MAAAVLFHLRPIWKNCLHNSSRRSSRSNSSFRIPHRRFRIFAALKEDINKSDKHNSNDVHKDDATTTSVDEQQQQQPTKTLAVATGEVFLRIASLLVRKPATGSTDSSSVSNPKLDDGVLWEQRPSDVEGEKEWKPPATSPGFSFSAAGLLFPYHLGVARFLLQNGYIKDTTPLAGSSAGAIVCAVIASGSSMEDTLVVTKKLAENCRLRGTAFRLEAILQEILRDFLPEDAHIRSSGRIRVAITQILWRPRGILVDKFDSRDDLIKAIITSSFIPGYLAARPATLFRNRLCIDGGLTLFIPPTSAPKTIQISAFPLDRLGFKEDGISPDCNPENRATVRQLFNWALEPADDDILDELYEFGYLDAAKWAEKNPLDIIGNEGNDINVMLFICIFGVNIKKIEHGKLDDWFHKVLIAAILWLKDHGNAEPHNAFMLLHRRYRRGGMCTIRIMCTRSATRVTSKVKVKAAKCLLPRDTAFSMEEMWMPLYSYLHRELIFVDFG